jgi:hypothetical protein
MPKLKTREKPVGLVMMKITAVLVDMLVEWNPELYGPYLV